LVGSILPDMIACLFQKRYPTAALSPQKVTKPIAAAVMYPTGFLKKYSDFSVVGIAVVKMVTGGGVEVLNTVVELRS